MAGQGTNACAVWCVARGPGKPAPRRPPHPAPPHTARGRAWRRASPGWRRATGPRRTRCPARRSPAGPGGEGRGRAPDQRSAHIKTGHGSSTPPAAAAHPCLPRSDTRLLQHHAFAVLLHRLLPRRCLALSHHVAVGGGCSGGGLLAVKHIPAGRRGRGWVGRQLVPQTQPSVFWWCSGHDHKSCARLPVQHTQPSVFWWSSGHRHKSCARLLARLLVAMGGAWARGGAGRGAHHTGMRWPHHSWREMHQSLMFSSQKLYTCGGGRAGGKGHGLACMACWPCEQDTCLHEASGGMSTGHTDQAAQPRPPSQTARAGCGCRRLPRPARGGSGHTPRVGSNWRGSGSWAAVGEWCKRWNLKGAPSAHPPPFWMGRQLPSSSPCWCCLSGNILPQSP